jgi:hypothetical protein
MSTRIASIGVGKLSTTSRYVGNFIVEIYSDSGYTVKIDSKVSGARWNGTVSVQTDYIQFDGLIFGTTYYLRAGVVTPVSGVISTWTTFSTAAGTSSAPGCTYGGTFTATTSGIGYVVTPASVPSDIDRFEAVWQFDSTVPTNTTISHWSGQLTNGVITFFVGGTPGQIAKVYVRGVNTAQQCQAWQLIDTRTVSTTWSGTTIGTIGDGTLLGTGGPAVNSGSTGRLGIGGTQDASNFLTTFGGYIANKTAGNAGYWSYDTSASPATFVTITNRGSGGYFIQDNGAGINRTQLNMSGALSVGGGAASDNILTAVGSTAGGPGRIGVTGTDSFLRQTATTVARSYGLYNTGGNYIQLDETAGLNRTTLNSSGQFGIGMSPSQPLSVTGAMQSFGSNAALWTADRTSGNIYAFYGTSNIPRLWGGSADFATFNPSTGAMGLGATYTGDWISVQGASVLDSNKVVAGGVRGYRFTGSGSATWVKLGTWTFNNAGSGRSVHVDIVSANGYNSGTAQQAHIELIARSGNASAAPNISGGSYYGRGGSTPVTGFKIVAVGGSTAVNNGAWELWVNTSTFADMIVSPMVDSGDTFVWAGTTGADPGAASSSIVVGVGGMVMNTGGTGTDAIIDSTGSPLSGGKRGFLGLTSSGNLGINIKIGGDSGMGVNGQVCTTTDIYIRNAGTTKVRIDNTGTGGHQWSVASI